MTQEEANKVQIIESRIILPLEERSGIKLPVVWRNDLQAMTLPELQQLALEMADLAIPEATWAIVKAITDIRHAREMTEELLPVGRGELMDSRADVQQKMSDL
jgi:hypothetical protein